VQNIVARIAGKEPGGRAVLLMAHYDGVEAGPAAGDDAAGTAALLETARALRTQPPLVHDIILLFTDGEEAGLLGAAAFVREHAWAKDVDVVLDFEARGTTGRSFMFETGPGNLDVARVLRRVDDVTAGSVFTTIYRVLPNDTDLSELAVLGRPALNFAFTEGPAADRDGNAISFIQSVFAPFGSRVIAGDTGVIMNNRLCSFGLDPSKANWLKPGKRPAHTLNTYMVFKGDEVFATGGSPGADEQPLAALSQDGNGELRDLPGVDPFFALDVAERHACPLHEDRLSDPGLIDCPGRRDGQDHQDRPPPLIGHRPASGATFGVGAAIYTCGRSGNPAEPCILRLT
jgi:hypothetical protein